ncbi:MAG: UDP-4-amino-4,6-dideoxy-N-acetyl-beta-L-altrosamine transaminase [Geopsychrobacter sp.]|nr:UDP-4-amino-4,6-dideoxy-N-acetyl-beta-L-altrosamine transaminase [Geopsychrobacter sp.]
MRCRVSEQICIPYGRQSVDEADIQAVVDVLRSGWLTTGPAIESFEKAVANFVEGAHAVAVSSGTAALHAAMYAIGIGSGDEVIVPPMTFVSTANAVIFQGGTPVFSDVRAEDLLIDPLLIEEKITSRTKAIIAVDYADQPCDYKALRKIADKHGIYLLSDACHSLGATYQGRPCGGLADLTVFSFHPVKPITTAEGGMVVTNSAEFAERLYRFRTHGITTDHWQRSEQAAWRYDMVDLGYNYRMSDIHAALGMSQLMKISDWISRRQKVASAYDLAFSGSVIAPLRCRDEVSHAYHLYVVRVPNREAVFKRLRSKGIGCNVHYLPVYLHSYYQQRLGLPPGHCAHAEAAYAEILTLPIFPGLTCEQQQRVTSALLEIIQ